MLITTMQLRKFLGAAAAAAVLLAVCGSELRAQTVVNGDFESDTDLWTVWPGYTGGGNPDAITGWTGTGGIGINPVVPGGDGDAPFRDNGDNTSSVAFLQGGVSVEQAVSGFTVGQEYILSLDFNARNCCGDAPIGTIFLNDIEVGSSVDLFPAPGSIVPVGDANPWYTVEIPFEAPVDTITIKVSAAPGVGGDATMLLDNVKFTAVPEPASGLLALLGTLGLLAVRRR